VSFWDGLGSREGLRRDHLDVVELERKKRKETSVNILSTLQTGLSSLG
jgi:hypothetical protein